MKNVLGNSKEVAQAWANGVNRKVRAGNVFTSEDGKTIYSYGRHFPMAAIVETDNAGKFAVINPNRYSVTTSNHQSQVRVANCLPAVCGVPHDTNHEQTTNYYKAELMELSDKLIKARKKELYQSQIDSLRAAAVAYFKAFGLELPETLQADKF